DVVTLFLVFYVVDPSPAEVYPLSLHDALPISSSGDSTFGSTTTSGRASAAARSSSSHHGVERPLTRSAVVRPSGPRRRAATARPDRKSTRLNSSHVSISYAVFCLKKKKQN